MSIAKRAVNNVFWLFISRVCTRVLTFLGTLYLARVLGVAGFGLYSLALAVSMYMWTVVDMGVTGYGTREIARDPGKAEELLKSLNSLRFVAAVAFFLLLGGILFILDLPDKTRWTILAGGFYVVAFAFSPDWVLRGIERMEYLALGNAAVGIAFLGSIYFLVKSSADTAAATLYHSLAFLLGSLITLIILKRKTGIGFSWEFSPSKWWIHLKESWYFAVDWGLVIIEKFIPFIFMGIWSTTEEVGFFSAPHRLILLIFAISAIIPQASYPILSSLYPLDKDKFGQTCRSLQKVMLYLGLPVGILGMLLSREIITLLYGNSYLSSAGILKIMVWVIPLIFLRVSYGKPLISAGFQRVNMFVNGSGVAVTASLCFLLVPYYGGYGAAWAMVMSNILTLTIKGLVFGAKLYRSNPFDFYFLRVAVASIAMGIIVSKLDFPVLLKIISGLGIYGGLSFLLRIISWKDILKLYQAAIPNRFHRTLS